MRYDYKDNRLTHIYDFNNNPDNSDEVPFLINEYDNRGRVTRQYMNDQNTFTFQYNEEARSTTLTDQNNKRQIYQFNALGQITSVQDDLGRIAYEYQDGRLHAIIDALGNRTTFTHDSAGNRTSVTYHTFGSTAVESEHFEYNSMNLVTRHLRRDRSLVYYKYDNRGNMEEMINVINIENERHEFIHRFTYDTNNNILTATDPLGNKTEFIEYDSMGNLLVSCPSRN
jgi:YD repeat-containing protein